MPTIREIVDTPGGFDIYAGGPGSGCHGGNCGRPSGSGHDTFIPKEPTEKQMAHEKMRIREMTEDQLYTRLGKMTKPQKLYAFYRALEDENYHQFNKMVIAKLKNYGWDGRGPVHAGGPGSGCHGPNCGRPSSGAGGGHIPKHSTVKMVDIGKYKYSSRRDDYVGKEKLVPESKAYAKDMKWVAQAQSAAKAGRWDKVDRALNQVNSDKATDQIYKLIPGNASGRDAKLNDLVEKNFPKYYEKYYGKSDKAVVTEKPYVSKSGYHDAGGYKMFVRQGAYPKTSNDLTGNAVWKVATYSKDPNAWPGSKGAVNVAHSGSKAAVFENGNLVHTGTRKSAGDYVKSKYGIDHKR